MEEDSLRFWIIPIICFVATAGIFVVILDYNYNVKRPNAIIEFAEMEKMNCTEMRSKLGTNLFWSMDNAKFAREMVQACSDAEAAVRKAEQDKLNKLLADPNSFESLSRDLERFQKLYDSHKEEYDFHSTQADILKHNVTDFENKINEINSKIQEKYTNQK